MNISRKLLKTNSFMIITNNRQRKSNLELYRILLMMLIVAHHFMGHSELIVHMNEHPDSWQTIYLYIYGAWGKTAINCFMMITGYFMCTQIATFSKFLKLLFQIEFYNIVIVSLLSMGGAKMSGTEIIKNLMPVSIVHLNFTGCFLLFYLLLPVLRKTVIALGKQLHLYTVIICLLIYVVLPFVHVHVWFNYVSWFIVLFFIASYIRLYPQPIYDRKIIWGWFTVISIILSSFSIVLMIYLRKAPLEYLGENSPLALMIAISSFLFFKNISVKSSQTINTISMTTFGVLLIHANNQTMTHWLWWDVIDCGRLYGNPWLLPYSLLIVLMVFFTFSLIDYLRISYIERPLIKYLSPRLAHIDRIVKQYNS